MNPWPPPSLLQPSYYKSQNAARGIVDACTVRCYPLNRILIVPFTESESKGSYKNWWRISMAGATIWKGYIHFGGTDVPVKLHSAVREERIQFNLLHSRDRVKLRQQMVCAYEKQPVPAEEQTKGFEVEEGKYIIIDPEELEQTVPE